MPSTECSSQAVDHRSIMFQNQLDHQSKETSRAKVSDTFLEEA